MLLAALGALLVVTLGAAVVKQQQIQAQAADPTTPEQMAALVAKARAEEDRIRLDSLYQVPRPVGRPMHVSFIGDSITEGSYATVDEKTFRGTMVSELSKDGAVRWDRQGRAGATTAEVLAMLPASLPKADLIVVELGTNDLGKTQPAEFARTYNRLLDTALAASPGAPLVCAGAWSGPNVVGAIDSAISTACSAHDGVFVSLSGPFDDARNRGPGGRPAANGFVTDEFHPNDAGHAAIAGWLLSRIAVRPAQS